MSTLGDWKITYDLSGQPRRVENPLDTQWRFEELKDGFWIDAQYQLVREPRGVYWIPPGRILVIEKRQ